MEITTDGDLVEQRERQGKYEKEPEGLQTKSGRMW